VADPGVTKAGVSEKVKATLDAGGVPAVVFDGIGENPTDDHAVAAIEAYKAAGADIVIALGGGSPLDVGKIVRIGARHPLPLDQYDAFKGGTEKLTEPVPPMIAIPTTAGTGSETTGVAIFDYEPLHAKTGIAHRALRPAMGILDPDNTRSLPPMVAACAGFDVLSHAVESLTALPFDQRPAPDDPQLRPAYQGANPISDVWASRAIEMMSRSMVRAVEDPDDVAARGEMLLAAAYAGIGFGNAGVHLPHGMSYPVSGMVRDYRPDGYAVDHPIVPHGMSVILNAPSVFRWTAQANPDRHLEAARLMGTDVRNVHLNDSGEILAGAIIALMRRTGMPSGLAAIGYTDADIPALVEGTLPQHRVTKLSPRPASAGDLARLFQDAMRYW
jgi:hydroxyacid-oxoacid transhydrogenase